MWWPSCGCGTANLTQRRRERRQRATARKRLWLHKSGLRRLPATVIVGLGKLLAKHHSRDTQFLSSIAEMATRDSRWQCRCGRYNGPTAEYCGQCGSFWQSGWYGYGRQQRPKSRAPSQSRRSQKGKGKGKDKNGGKEDQ